MASEQSHDEASSLDGTQDKEETVSRSAATDLDDKSEDQTTSTNIEPLCLPSLLVSNGEVDHFDEDDSDVTMLSCRRSDVTRIVQSESEQEKQQEVWNEAENVDTGITRVELTEDTTIGRDSAVTDTSASTLAEPADKEMVEFKVVYNKQTYNVTFPLDSTVLDLKKHIEELTDVLVSNQKIMFKGLMKDELSLRDHKLTTGSKLMVVGSKVTDIQSVSQTTSKAKEVEKAAVASVKEPLSKQKPHKMVLEKYGKPEDVMPGIRSKREGLPAVPLSGMYNKVGSKVRLTFKLESDQLWVGTKERTEKITLSSIKAIVNEPIEGHEEYHLMGIQLGPTEASRYWIYWVPAQYVDSIKDTVLGNWQYF